MYYNYLLEAIQLTRKQHRYIHDIIKHVLHSEYYTFTKHKIISHGSQTLSFLTETEMACGNAL